MKTLLGIAMGAFRLVKYGVILLLSALRQRLARRRAAPPEMPDRDVTPKPLPA